MLQPYKSQLALHKIIGLGAWQRKQDGVLEVVPHSWESAGDMSKSRPGVLYYTVGAEKKC